MVTYWPITNKNTPDAQRAECPHLVSNYAHTEQILKGAAEQVYLRDVQASCRSPPPTNAIRALALAQRGRKRHHDNDARAHRRASQHDHDEHR
jgi:hypothetical protein